MDILRDLFGIASCIGSIIVGIRSLPKIFGSSDKEEEMNEEQRVVLFMGIGFVLFFVSVNLPFPWWIIGLVITTVVLLIGSWPFWEDLAIAAWYLLTNKKD